MQVGLVRPGILVARHTAPDREGVVIRKPHTGSAFVYVVWLDDGETGPVPVEHLMQVVRPGPTTIGAPARKAVQDAFRVRPDGPPRLNDTARGLLQGQPGSGTDKDPS